MRKLIILGLCWALLLFVSPASAQWHGGGHGGGGFHDGSGFHGGGFGGQHFEGGPHFGGFPGGDHGAGHFLRHFFGGGVYGGNGGGFDGGGGSYNGDDMGNYGGAPGVYAAPPIITGYQCITRDAYDGHIVSVVPGICPGGQQYYQQYGE